MSMISRQRSILNIRKLRATNNRLVIAQRLRLRSCAKACRSGRFSYGGWRLGLSRINRSTFSKPSPTRRLSRSRTCACSTNSGAQRRIARGPGASDGDRRGARHYQPFANGRAAGPPGDRRERSPKLCGVDDVVLRLEEEDMMISRAHFGPDPHILAVSKSVSMSHGFRWMREHGTLHIPDAASRILSQRWVPSATGAPGLAAPLRQQGEFIGALSRAGRKRTPSLRHRSSCWRPSRIRR